MSDKWYPGKNIQKHLSKKDGGETTNDQSNDAEFEAARAAAIKAKELNKKDEGKWYPGKNVKELVKSKKNSSSTAPSSGVNSDDSSTSQRSKSEEKWYPGKHIQKLVGTDENEIILERVSAASAAASDTSTTQATTSTEPDNISTISSNYDDKINLTTKSQNISSQEDDMLDTDVPSRDDSAEDIAEQERLALLVEEAENKWYPGKLLGKVPRPLRALRRHVITKRHLQQSTHDQSMRVGTLKVSLLRGKALTGMQRPYAELNVEGFEQRTKSGKGSSPDWQNENPFVFNVVDLSRATLSIHLFDDYNLHHDACVGRVLVPLISLLSSSSLAPGEAGTSVMKTACSVLLGGQLNKPSDASEAAGEKDATLARKSKTSNAIETLLSPELGSVPAARRWFRVFPPASSLAVKLKGSSPEMKVTPAATPVPSSSSERSTSLDSQKSDHSNGEATSGSSHHEPVDQALKAQFLANNRYESGVAGIPGSAMSRPKSLLGYIELELELTLGVGTAAAYILFNEDQVADATDNSIATTQTADNTDTMKSGSSTANQQASSSSSQDGSAKESREKENQEKEIEQLQPKVLRENMARLKRCFNAKAPLLASPLVRRFILVPLAIRVCFFMSAKEFPHWVFILFVIHGFLAHRQIQRTNLMGVVNQYEDDELENLQFEEEEEKEEDIARKNAASTATVNAVKIPASGWSTVPALKNEREWRKVPPWILIFEDELGPATMPKGVIAKIKLLKDTVAKLQSFTGKLATAMERSSNLWNWSDPIVTALATCALAVACLFTSLILSILSLRLIICTAMIAFLLKHEIKSIKEKKAAAAAVGGDDATSDETKKKLHKSAAAKAKKQALIAKSAMASLLAKIPDEAEIAHRTIASLQPLTEKEMLREIAASSLKN